MAKDYRKLENSAYNIADSFRSGLYEEIEDRSWDKKWKFMIEKLKEFAPGFTDAEYGKALNRGMEDTR